MRAGFFGFAAKAMAGVVVVWAAVFWGSPAWAEDACKPFPCCEDRESTEPSCPAAYHNMRFMENWRPCLCKDVCDFDDISDRLKGRRLVRNGFLWANFGGQVRLRWESFSNIGFGAPADPNDAWMLVRGRAHADVHFGDHARVFVEGIYANQYERRELGPRPIDINKGDILNLFAEVKGTLGCNHEVGAWGGRRELQLGKQRLVSPLDWANTRRTFEGGGVWWKHGFHRVDAWYTRPVVIMEDSFDDEGDEDATFFGLNYENRTKDCRTWEVYALGLQLDETANRPAQDRFTVGARIDGKIANTRLDYDLEGAYQFGDIGAGSIAAFMASATLGWQPCWPCWSPRFAIGGDIASGDDDPNDADAGTFHQLFPLAHAYFGHADLIGRQNILAGRVEASVKPTDKLTIQAWFHMFFRADEADAVYNVGGGVLRAVPMGGNDSLAIGSELDIKATYKLDRHWTAFVEWAHFFPGAFIEETGASEDVDVWYIGMQGTF